eukprot:495608-Prorocentrum_minimum.AAC.5
MFRSATSISMRQVLGQPQGLQKAAKPGVRAQSKRQNRTQVVVRASGDKKEGGGFDSGGAMWGGRFEEKVSDVVERFGQSVSFDKKLYKQVSLQHPCSTLRAHSNPKASFTI